MACIMQAVHTKDLSRHLWFKCQIKPEVIETTYMGRFDSASIVVTLSNYAGTYKEQFHNPDGQQNIKGGCRQCIG